MIKLFPLDYFALMRSKMGTFVVSKRATYK